jgi:hypothetical protein
MWGRRKQPVEGTAEADAAAEVPEEENGAADPRANGPWDSSEVDLEAARVDLGSLLVTPRDDVELQLQVEEATGEVAAVILGAEDGAVELRAFAAPRNGDIWDGLRRTIAAEVARLGGTATEQEGPWGTELAVSLLVDLPDGGRAPQTSKVIGIPGPRWLLRCTLFGHPAEHHHEDGPIESALRDVVVVRGNTPIPPGDALPLTLPPDARPVPAVPED